MSSMIFTIPNFITLLRFPLALAFLQDNPHWRALALLLTMLTDGLDGYLARRYSKISRLGTFLDPLADKFFVLLVLIVMLNENRLSLGEAAAMLGRDFSVVIFGCYLAWKGTLGDYQFRAIWCGKLTTALQLIVLIGLVYKVSFPPFMFASFIVLGLLALGELYLERAKLKVES